MEAADPILTETKEPIFDDRSINFIDELEINKEYKIKFGIKEYTKELLIIEVIPDNYKEIFFYQKAYTIHELQNLSEIFTIYKNTKDLISFLKDRQFKIEEKNEAFNIKFNIYLPNGQGKLIELNLKKNRKDDNTIIKYFLEKNKDFENNVRNIKEKLKQEIEDLKKINENQKAIINENRENIMNCRKEISKLKEEKNFFVKIIKMILGIFFICFIILSVIIYKLYNQCSNETEYNRSNEDYKKKFNSDDAIININKEISKDKNDINNITKKIKNFGKNIKEQKSSIEDNNNNLSFLKEQIIKYIQILLGGNKIDSKLFLSKNPINFILNYIRKNDKYVNCNEIKLLYRGSIDGDRTKRCHKLCDNKKNVIIFIQSDKGYIFGGYSKIGFKTTKKREYIIDNNSFLFSIDLRKIYPVIKDKTALIYDNCNYGLCFFGLCFKDNFMNIENNFIGYFIYSQFQGLNDEYEINGDEEYLKIKELEVFQLI